MTDNPASALNPTGDVNVRHLDLAAMADALLGRLNGREREVESVFKDARVSILLIAFEAGGVLKEHNADGTVLIQAVRGRVNLTASDDRIALGPGELVQLQAGIRHDVRAPERAVIMVTIAAH